MNSSNSPADPGVDAGPAVDVDRALLAALARDGRASYTELAERVGLSVSASSKRLAAAKMTSMPTSTRAKARVRRQA